MRVGVIGCGRIGSRRAEVAQRAGDDIVVVADIDDNRARELAARFGGRHSSKWEDVITSRDVDVVVVATFSSALAGITARALAADKHVLCEKPMATGTADANMVLESARQTRRVAKVGFNHRFHPAIIKARELAVDKGRIGRVLGIRAAYGHGGRTGYEREWRANAALAGGGELLDQGIHVVDLARWFLGELDLVGGATTTWVWPISPLEDNAFALLRTRDSRVASIHASWTQWRNMFRFEILGETGYLTVDGLGGHYGPETLTLGERGTFGQVPRETRWNFDGPDRSWHDEWSDFVSAIRDQRRPIGDVEDGVAAIRIIEAIYAFSRSYRPKE